MKNIVVSLLAVTTFLFSVIISVNAQSPVPVPTDLPNGQVGCLNPDGGGTHCPSGYSCTENGETGYCSFQQEYTGWAACSAFPRGYKMSCGPRTEPGAMYPTTFLGTCNAHSPSLWGDGCQINCLCCPPGQSRQCGEVTSTYEVPARGSYATQACGQNKYLSQRANPVYEANKWKNPAENPACFFVRYNENKGQDVYACNTVISTCGNTGCACQPATTISPEPTPLPTATPTMTPVPPTATPTPLPPPKCEKLEGALGGVNVSTSTSRVKYGDTIVFVATANGYGVYVKSMTFQVTTTNSTGTVKVLDTKSVDTITTNGVITGTYTYTFNTVGKIRVEVVSFAIE